MTLNGLAAQLSRLGAKVERDLPLNKRVFWRAGGPAELWVEARDLDQLRVVMDAGVAVTPLGRGSNSLVSDAGIRGVVLKLGGELAGLELDGDRAAVGGGLFMNVLIARLDKLGRVGAEAFVGIPGTIGGGVVMNAGCRMGEACDILESVRVVLPGSVRELSVEDCGFAYRHSALPEGAVVASAVIRVSDQEVDAVKAQRVEFLARRKATQPLDKPSCGSTFTNPPGDHAARLIDAAGLKGHRIGGAWISEKHANFFLNQGGSAEDIRQLIVHARRVVFERFGVMLTPEVKLLGEWGPDPFGI